MELLPVRPSGVLLSAALLLNVCCSAYSAEQQGPVKETLCRVGDVLSSPARLDSSSALWLGGLAAGGLLLYSEDGQIRSIFKKNRSASNDSTSKLLEKFGNGGYDLAIAGVYGGLGYVFKKPGMRRTAVLAAESFLAANTVTTLVKYVAGRARPYTGNGKDTFRPFKMKTANTSFPSGHTTSAFSVASVFAYRSDSVLLGVGAYALASGVALQRVYADKHWASDAFAGAALGTVVGRWIAAREEKKGGAASAMLLPVYSHDYSGVSAVFTF